MTHAATAPSLNWSQELALGHALLDQTHQEFIDLLGRAEAAEDNSLILRLQALVEHTVEHFAMEDHWMRASAFGPVHCHSSQHQVVIQTLHELLRRAREEGDLGLTREILPELGTWFAQHAQTMDAMLTWHLDQVGFDPLTGQMSRAPTPSATPSGVVAGCSSAPCG